jgi:putative oxygen-independent coproporphyrinogen III oxidase
MTVSAYIHIPFCSHKCDFCDFAAFAGLDHLAPEYCQIVQREIDERLNLEAVSEKLASIFYGGGTPGLIEPSLLGGIHSKLVTRLELVEEAEISLETTPHSITLDKANAWLNLGINRLSIGVETFSDLELKAIGRDHTREQAMAGIDAAVKAGFQNISCDLMYALPTQTIVSWKSSLDELFTIASDYDQIKHFSSYGLHLASNSPLFSRFPKSSESYPNDEIYNEMYELLVRQATAAGFEQYEVSNFSRPGCQSRHNLSYWNNSDYLAFGVSAHRYRGGIRSSNWRSLARYMQDPLGHEVYEVITPEMRQCESIMLGLRKIAGINLDAFEAEFGFRLEYKNEAKIERLVAGGFVRIADGCLSLTQQAVPISNSVIAELI